MNLLVLFFYFGVNATLEEKLKELKRLEPFPVLDFKSFH